MGSQVDIRTGNEYIEEELNECKKQANSDDYRQENIQKWPQMMNEIGIEESEAKAFCNDGRESVMCHNCSRQALSTGNDAYESRSRNNAAMKVTESKPSNNSIANLPNSCNLHRLSRNVKMPVTTCNKPVARSHNTVQHAVSIHKKCNHNDLPYNANPHCSRPSLYPTMSCNLGRCSGQCCKMISKEGFTVAKGVLQKNNCGSVKIVAKKVQQVKTRGDESAHTARSVKAQSENYAPNCAIPLVTVSSHFKNNASRKSAIAIIARSSHHNKERGFVVCRHCGHRVLRRNITRRLSSSDPVKNIANRSTDQQ
ncbi:unnamed protein product [Thelazia callipaeda]|uniref:C2H2-type domain-containing protein n=1 Tax=Thelazia callipaeda TaxID=103827 RepID=A0A0N5CZR2_THECL|nr:unnamed protein product [Thelazia callipaeda]